MAQALLDRMKSRWHALGAGTYAAALAAVVLGVCGVVGVVLHLPWLFPSLGPTVMLFFESPEQEASRPINALVGHGVDWSPEHCASTHLDCRTSPRLRWAGSPRSTWSAGACRWR
jgi:hypothetical protein